VRRFFSAKFALPAAVYAVIAPQLAPLLALLELQHDGDGVQQQQPQLQQQQQQQHSQCVTECSPLNARRPSLHADTPTAIAFAKGMLQSVLLGERIARIPLADGSAQAASSSAAAAAGGASQQLPPLWHASFARKEAEAALEQLNSTLAGTALVRRDASRRELRVWGERAARERAIAAVRALHDAATRQRHALRVKPEHYRSIVRHGLLSQIESACKARSVSLVPATRSLLVEGDEDVARRALGCVAGIAERALAASTQGGGDGRAGGRAAADATAATCPVCYCEPEDDAIELGCGHRYSSACSRDWASASAAGGGGASTFPLVCLDERCEDRVAVADLRRALPAEQLARLMRSALDEHVNSHLERLQFCLSPGCAGISTVAEARTARCSACALSICTRCKVEEHDGLTCREALEAKAPPDRLRHKVIDEILTLRCLRCAQAFLDFEGCFALECGTCPCRFCGWCLRDCGTDAHPHVATCAAKPPDADRYFGKREQFEEAKRKWQANQLERFFAELDERERES
jgi:hypothetical protein